MAYALMDQPDMALKFLVSSSHTQFLNSTIVTGVEDQQEDRIYNISIYTECMNSNS